MCNVSLIRQRFSYGELLRCKKIVSFDHVCITPSATQYVMKEAIEEPGFMSRIKCDSACTDESILCLAL